MNKLLFLLTFIFCLIIFYPSSAQAAACKEPEYSGALKPQPIVKCEPHSNSPFPRIVDLCLYLMLWICGFYFLFERKMSRKTRTIGLIVTLICYLVHYLFFEKILLHLFT